MRKSTLEALLKRNRAKSEAHTDAAAANLSASQEKTAENTVAEHAQKRTGVHGTGPEYVAKTPRSDQRVSFKDLADVPELALAEFDLGDILSHTPANNKAPRAPATGLPFIDDGWLSFAIARIADLTWSNITGKPSTFPPSAHDHPHSDITDWDEAVQDVIGAKVVPGTNVSVSYDDTTGETTVSATGAGDLNYRHVQSTPSATWTITHNLNKYVSVSVVDSTGDLVIGDISYDSPDQVTLSFSAAFGGEAYLN